MWPVRIFTKEDLLQAGTRGQYSKPSYKADLFLGVVGEDFVEMASEADTFESTELTLYVCLCNVCK